MLDRQTADYLEISQASNEEQIRAAINAKRRTWFNRQNSAPDPTALVRAQEHLAHLDRLDRWLDGVSVPGTVAPPTNRDSTRSAPQPPSTPPPRHDGPGPNPLVPTSRGRRFGAFALDLVLAMVTCGIGWVGWSLATFSNGQTPGKQLLHMKTVRRVDGTIPSWGTMFVREMVLKNVAWFAVGITSGLAAVGCVWFLWDSDRQQLWDKMVGTLVVDE